MSINFWDNVSESWNYVSLRKVDEQSRGDFIDFVCEKMHFTQHFSAQTSFKYCHEQFTKIECEFWLSDSCWVSSKAQKKAKNNQSSLVSLSINQFASHSSLHVWQVWIQICICQLTSAWSLMEHRNHFADFTRLLPQLAHVTICDAIHSANHLGDRFLCEILIFHRTFRTLDTLRMCILIFDASFSIRAFDELTGICEKSNKLIRKISF